MRRYAIWFPAFRELLCPANEITPSSLILNQRWRLSIAQSTDLDMGKERPGFFQYKIRSSTTIRSLISVTRDFSNNLIWKPRKPLFPIKPLQITENPNHRSPLCKVSKETRSHVRAESVEITQSSRKVCCSVKPFTEEWLSAFLRNRDFRTERITRIRKPETQTRCSLTFSHPFNIHKPVYLIRWINCSLEDVSSGCLFQLRSLFIDFLLLTLSSILTTMNSINLNSLDSCRHREFAFVAMSLLLYFATIKKLLGLSRSNKNKATIRMALVPCLESVREGVSLEYACSLPSFISEHMVLMTTPNNFKNRYQCYLLLVCSKTSVFMFGVFKVCTLDYIHQELSMSSVRQMHVDRFHCYRMKTEVKPRTTFYSYGTSQKLSISLESLAYSSYCMDNNGMPRNLDESLRLYFKNSVMQVLLTMVYVFFSPQVINESSRNRTTTQYKLKVWPLEKQNGESKTQGEQHKWKQFERLLILRSRKKIIWLQTLPRKHNI